MRYADNMTRYSNSKKVITVLEEIETKGQLLIGFH